MKKAQRLYVNVVCFSLDLIHFKTTLINGCSLYYFVLSSYDNGVYVTKKWLVCIPHSLDSDSSTKPNVFVSYSVKRETFHSVSQIVGMVPKFKNWD